MVDNDLNWIIGPLASILNGNGVFILSVILTVIFWLVYRKKRSRQLLNSLPGLFTSLGLLGTFVAICQSLGKVSEDSLEVDKIINNLVPAFTSSIAGLISAFLVTVVLKIVYSYEDRKLDDKVKNISPEEFLFNLCENLKETKSILLNVSYQLKEQSRRDEKYNEKLNSTISQQSAILESFINGFVIRMNDIFSEMRDQIEQNIKGFGEEQFKKSAEVLQELTTNLLNMSGAILQEQKSSVQYMITDTNKELQMISSTFSFELGTMGGQITKALSLLGTVQNERLNAIISNCDELSNRLVSQNLMFAEKISEQMTEEYAKVQQHSVESIQQMTDLKDAYHEINVNMLRNATNMNQQVSDELRASLSEFVGDIQTSFNNEVNMLSTAIRANVKALDDSYGYISEHVANIKGNYESAAIAFEDSVKNAHRMNESQEMLLQTVDKSMKEVVRTNEKVGQAISILEDRQENVESLIAHINEIGATIEVLQKLEGQLNRIISK